MHAVILWQNNFVGSDLILDRYVESSIRMFVLSSALGK